MSEKVRIGVNACLLGEPVRYDGGHKRDRYITEVLSDYLEFVPVCPEVECGFGVPREAFRLVGDPERPRLVTRNTGVDQTEHLEQWARKRVRNDPGLRESFIEAIFTMRRWREALARRRTLKNLIDFHTRHKLLLMAHSPQHYRALGRLVAQGKGTPSAELYRGYEKGLLEALHRRATPGRHANVLEHLLGYFKQSLSSDEKQELLEIIEQYRQGLIPLIVPITLLNHHVRKHDPPYLRDQVYLQPHPVELKLRNHA